MKTGITKESEIIADLKRLHSAYVPEPSRLVVGNDDPGRLFLGNAKYVFTNGERFSVLKLRLERLEAELQTERRLRLEAEKSLEDIKKERSAPFIVPALLDAFLALSKLSSKVGVMHSEG